MASNPNQHFEALPTSSIESALSLVNLPRELGLSVAGFLDLKDLSNLEATSKSHKNLVRSNMNPVWKQLRDNRWTYGKLLWHAGPTFERSSDGAVIAVDNDLANWRDEVRRRVEIDNSLPGRLARFDAAKAGEDAATTEEEELSFEEDGGDIFDWLLAHRNDPEYDSARVRATLTATVCAVDGMTNGNMRALNLARQAAEGGDQCAAEFMRNKENNLIFNNLRCRSKLMQTIATNTEISRYVVEFMFSP